jgi:hypothetical protein
LCGSAAGAKAMNLKLAEKIASAVLYEGYILYPYRATAIKNQQRFNFGVLVPRAYSEAQAPNTEKWEMQTQCLVQAEYSVSLDVTMRFLQVVQRETGELLKPLPDWPQPEESALPEVRFVPSLEINGRLYPSWQEAVEREVKATKLDLQQLLTAPQRVEFSFPAQRELEPLRDEQGVIGAVFVRTQATIKGALEVTAARIAPKLYQVTVRLLNLTPLEQANQQRREASLRHSFISTHTLLGAYGGEFVSLLDPPESYQEAAKACQNIGTWPVLVGAENERDLMLSSPIILYDYPQIAAESMGDFFDGTEIDEMLALRVMTLTDEEKREMRSVDERARQILERTETLPPEQMMKLHGVLRNLRPREETQ